MKLFESVAFQHTVGRALGYTQCVGHTASVPVVLDQQLVNVAALDLVQSRLALDQKGAFFITWFQRFAHTCVHNQIKNLKKQITGVDQCVGTRNDEGTFDHVAQLAHVARPLVIAQPTERFG